MNKNIFRLMAMLFVVLAGAGFTACFDDDDDAPTPDAPASIAGLWQVIDYIHWEERFGTEYDPEEGRVIHLEKYRRTTIITFAI